MILWNYGLSYVRLPRQLKDIRLLLDQCSEVENAFRPNFWSFGACGTQMRY
ncbi:hypothetical protein Godav_000969 [Gossypium davidsonii]|uniref:Uncharacterized protein n=1 Tax=Gossypium davidsonii TaxID=34287 RepID=A0A7J8T298_GOSDV|nr:hypothetical protein [Gossypium davidsonii]